MDTDDSKVCVAMFYDGGVGKYAAYSEAINRRYAEKHGYQFHIFRERFDTAENRAPQWDKVKVVGELMEDPGKDCELLMWIDADAAFFDHQTRIQDVFGLSVRASGKQGADLVVASDIMNAGMTHKLSMWKSYVNTGTFMVHNTPWSRKFFDWWWTHPGKWRHDSFHEQSVLGEAYNENKLSAKDKVVVVPEKEINSYVGDTYDKTWIWHLMGQAEEPRVERLSKVFAEIEGGVAPSFEKNKEDAAADMSSVEGKYPWSSPFCIAVVALVSVLAILVGLFIRESWLVWRSRRRQAAYYQNGA